MRLKRIICTVLVMIVSFGFCGCTTTQHEWGDFMYQKLGNGRILLCDLSPSGKKKKEVVIPAKINGENVSEITKNLGMGAEGWSKSENLEKIYYPHHIETAYYAFFDCAKLQKIILVYYTGRGYKPGYSLDSPNRPHEYYKSKVKEIYPESKSCANVSYYYNYSDSPNDGYYWIDDYGYGEKITFIPSEPTREHYTFGGWFCEPDCVTEWNFESDTLPTEIIEEEEVVYQETKLYAKWVAE